MDSPEANRPRRQDSTVSSASSGNRTVRASSNRGRRRSSASQTGNAASGIFARLIGKGRVEDEQRPRSNESSPSPSPDDSEPEAGPSDYWRRTPSPSSPVETPPAAWRTLSTEEWPSDPEDGNADIWRPNTPPNGTGDFPRTPPYTTFSPSAGTPDPEFLDNDEYERRLQDVFSVSSPRPNGSDSQIPASPPVLSADLRRLRNRGYDAELREIVGDEEKREVTGIGEEEFGMLEFPQNDDASDKTPSTSSMSAAGNPTRPGPGVVTPSPVKRGNTPYLHPSVSRLRSTHLRSSSSTTQNSFVGRPTTLAHARVPSHFSQISVSRSDTMSTTSGINLPPIVPAATPATKSQPPAFNFHPLRHLSAHLFSRTSSGRSSPSRPAPARKASSVFGLSTAALSEEEIILGRPAVIDVRGMIAVGTDHGYVVVYGFNQNIKHILGSPSTTAVSGAVTAVTISSDQTYIAVGHATGNIHLYDLANSTKPARSTYALPLKQILSGRKEGHLQGSRILHLGFVGSRHTSVVSGDEHGRAFWWSLGKVMGVESNDVVRMLGSYPEKAADTVANSPTGSAANSIKSGYPSKKPTTLFAAMPLPLGETDHSTDQFHFTALLTPVKLVIVGMKPSAKTWFRKMRENIGGNRGGQAGCATWLRSGELDTKSDPVLAYSWGPHLRFLRVRVSAKTDAPSADSKDTSSDIPEFVEGNKYDAPDVILALQWYDKNHILVVVAEQLILLDVASLRVVEDTPLQTRLLTSNDFFSALNSRGPASGDVPLVIAASVRVHRERLFLLTQSNVQVGNLLHWNDRVLASVHRGDFLDAIQVALSYYESRANGNSIGLSDDPDVRRTTVGKRIRELMRASLDWAFSEDRMHDDTHYSSDGRGVDLTGLFEGLAKSCIEACLSMHDLDFLFNDTYESYSDTGIHAIFLEALEPYIFDGRIRDIPPNIIQALISTHEAKDELDLAEAIIWHVEPSSLDINQAVNLCEAHGLWDALIHVYTRAMRDYVAPIVKLLQIIHNIQNQRHNGPNLVGEPGAQISEAFAADAYKIFAYIEQVLSGTSYPTGEALPPVDADAARVEVYGFLFSGRILTWPEGSGGEVVLPEQSDKAYPYLDLLLQFDTEAFLHSMDIAFEDPYLNDSRSAVSRQTIINIMLDSMNSDSFYFGDTTLLHIFVARNLPKYPQFLFIPPSTLHGILVSLANDPDQSTREDRQLAAEYMLSAYTPHDLDAMLRLFEQAQFFRILREYYKRERKWTSLVDAYVRDPDIDVEVFVHLDEVIGFSKKGITIPPEVIRGIENALPYLTDLSVRQTALLVDKDVPALHNAAIDSLASSEHKQIAYLRSLLEPSTEDIPIDDTRLMPPRQGRTVNLDTNARIRYVKLLSTHDSSAVVAFLDRKGPDFFDLAKLANEFRLLGHSEGQLWALDRQGKFKETFDTAGDILRFQGADLGQAIVSQDEGSIHLTLQTLQSVSRLAIRLCQEHTAAGTEGVEDMWYGVLHDIIDLNHSVASLVDGQQNIGHIAESLRALVQETLQSLVASSSPSLSFSRLFKRLVDSSNTSSKAAKRKRAYSEFRSILTGMLESYRTEGEMLRMTTRLVEADLFVSVKEKTMRRQRGWRPDESMCATCGGGLYIEGKRDLGLVGAVQILGSGDIRHVHCADIDQSKDESNGKNRVLPERSVAEKITGHRL